MSRAHVAVYPAPGCEYAPCSAVRSTAARAALSESAACCASKVCRPCPPAASVKDPMRRWSRSTARRTLVVRSCTTCAWCRSESDQRSVHACSSAAASASTCPPPPCRSVHRIVKPVELTAARATATVPWQDAQWRCSACRTGTRPCRRARRAHAPAHRARFALWSYRSLTAALASTWRLARPWSGGNVPCARARWASLRAAACAARSASASRACACKGFAKWSVMSSRPSASFLNPLSAHLQGSSQTLLRRRQVGHGRLQSVLASLALLDTLQQRSAGYLCLLETRLHHAKLRRFGPASVRTGPYAGHQRGWVQTWSRCAASSVAAAAAAA